jgi:hypothetical protein
MSPLKLVCVVVLQEPKPSVLPHRLEQTISRTGPRLAFEDNERLVGETT